MVDKFAELSGDYNSLHMIEGIGKKPVSAMEIMLMVFCSELSGNEGTCSNRRQ